VSISKASRNYCSSIVQNLQVHRGPLRPLSPYIVLSSLLSGCVALAGIILFLRQYPKQPGL
jgi:hypothetical protein